MKPLKIFLLAFILSACIPTEIVLPTIPPLPTKTSTPLPSWDLSSVYRDQETGDLKVIIEKKNNIVQTASSAQLFSVQDRYEFDCTIDDLANAGRVTCTGDGIWYEPNERIRVYLVLGTGEGAFDAGTWWITVPEYNAIVLTRMVTETTTPSVTPIATINLDRSPAPTSRPTSTPKPPTPRPPTNTVPPPPTVTPLPPTATTCPKEGLWTLYKGSQTCKIYTPSCSEHPSVESQQNFCGWVAERSTCKSVCARQ